MNYARTRKTEEENMKRCIEKPLVRWMIRRDMPEVLALESRLQEPWGEEEYESLMKRRNAIAMVAELGEVVRSVVAYELHANMIAIRRLVQGEGGHVSAAALLDKLKSKLSQSRRNRILTDVWQGDVDTCKLLSANGFDVIMIDNPNDVYIFAYQYKG